MGNHKNCRIKNLQDNTRYDEFRMLDLSIINMVLKKFLSTPRQPKFMDKPKYKENKKKYIERNKEFYLSSAWFVAHWSYAKMLSYANNFLDTTKRYFLCGLPYQLSIMSGLLDADQLADEMSESDFNELTHSMEMECLWQGSADGALFEYNNISKLRKLERAYYPSKIANLLSDKKLKIPPKQPGEVRILSLDVALMSSKKRDNDASSIFITQLIPNTSKRYITNVIYTENVEDVTTDELALVARRYFHEFDCDWLIQDTAGKLNCRPRW